MNINLVQILLGLGLSAIIGLIAYRLRSLSKSGVIGTILIGTIIFGLGGTVFAIPLLFFFISSSLFSKLKNETKRNSIKQITKPGPRALGQVIANGGPAAIFAITYAVKGNPIWFVGFLACLCESAADTWATEIGTLSKSAPISIVSFKPMPPGQSGAISLWGTIASVVAAISTMALAEIYASISGPIPYWPIQIWLAAAYAGFIGALIDSVLGATLQGLYRCDKCGRIIEEKSHCGQKAIIITGIGIINNDIVNFISSFLAGILALWIVT
jgi:uncharacterized protein (TIGR00297 family)